MRERLRPALTLSDIYGPGCFFFSRAIDGFCDWLPAGADVLDSLTGGQLTIAGDLPIICSQGFDTSAARELIALGGLELAPFQVQFGAGGALAALSRASGELGGKVVMQHAWPPGALDGAQPWMDLELLQYLNDKARLSELVPAGHVPARRVADRAVYFGRGDSELPAVLKVVTGQSNGGGCGVTVCRTAGDLSEAERLFGACDRIVVEELLEIVRNPCLNFAVMPGGEVRYLGFADQDISAEGKYRGNWIDFGLPIAKQAVDVALEPVRRGAAMGYRGVAGVDLAFASDGRILALDLNFRLNGCTTMILLADAVRESTGAGVILFSKLQGTVGAEALANALTPFVESGGIVPLSLFDPEAAGYRGKPGSAQVLVTGASREEVLAVEAGIEAAIA
jgi:hypothetical protein